MKLVSNQKGTAMTETVCIIALIAIAAIASLGFVGQSIADTFNNAGNQLSSNLIELGPGGGQFTGKSFNN